MNYTLIIKLPKIKQKDLWLKKTVIVKNAKTIILRLLNMSWEYIFFCNKSMMDILSKVDFGLAKVIFSQKNSSQDFFFRLLIRF